VKGGARKRGFRASITPSTRRPRRRCARWEGPA